jgi:hypothetical protein
VISSPTWTGLSPRTKEERRAIYWHLPYLIVEVYFVRINFDEINSFNRISCNRAKAWLQSFFTSTNPANPAASYDSQKPVAEIRAGPWAMHRNHYGYIGGVSRKEIKPYTKPIKAIKLLGLYFPGFWKECPHVPVKLL